MTENSDRWRNFDLLLGRVLDGVQMDDDVRELSQVLRADAEACRRYMSCVHLHAWLAWGRGLEKHQTPVPGANGGRKALDRFAESHDDDTGSLLKFMPQSFKCGTAGRNEGGLADGELDSRAMPPPLGVQSSGSRAQGPDSPDCVPPLIPHPASLILHNSHLLGSVALSYGLAMLLLGTGLLAAWAWNKPGVISPRVAVDGMPGTGSVIAKPAVLGVARITAMTGCRWEDLGTTAVSPDGIPVGHKFVLKSGILEISYNSGAAVILQGPTTYEVESDKGGILSAGKLTAHVEARGVRGQEFSVQRSGSVNLPSFLTPSPSSFVLRTPTATITSAAGEMGIEVRGAQTCRVCVFAGQAELRSNGSGGEGALVERLGENQSAEAVEVGAKQVVRRISQPELAASFARRIVRPVFPKMSAPDQQLAGIWLKSIGPEITEGRLLAIGGGEDIELSRAASPGEKGGIGGAEQTFRVHEGPGGMTFTSRQVFEVNDVALDTAMVRGWYITQGRVSAVRFNGKSLAGFVRGNGRIPDGSGGFLVGSGLVRPVNTLQMDFSGVTPPGPQNNNLFWLRLRVSGIRLPGQKAPPVLGAVPGGSGRERSNK